MMSDSASNTQASASEEKVLCPEFLEKRAHFPNNTFNIFLFSNFNKKS